VAENQIHQTSIALVESIPDQVEAGTDIPLKAKVTCASGCDLRGKTISILAQDGALLGKASLSGLEEGSNTTDEFTVKVPLQPGPCAWTVVFPAQEDEGAAHAASVTSVTFRVKPHASSLVVWDVPSPVMMGSPFTIKVGARCSADCQLSGAVVEVQDERGAMAASGTLGETPWPDTTALYWTEVRVPAPSTEGVYSWTVQFPATVLKYPHEASSSTFSFRASRPPEHKLTVRVLDANTQSPIKNARVYVHPYDGYTDERGIANVGVVKGKHELWIIVMEYDEFKKDIQVTGDLTLKVELRPPNTQW
jgi:hypothetical protein